MFKLQCFARTFYMILCFSHLEKLIYMLAEIHGELFLFLRKCENDQIREGVQKKWFF